MQKSQGQHASFWSQPVGGNHPGSDVHEIDIIEYFGDKHPQGGLTSFIHWYKGKKLIKTGSWIKDSTTFLTNKKDGWSKNYHVFSVQWTPKTIIFRIDGKETWRTSARVANGPFFSRHATIFAADDESSPGTRASTGADAEFTSTPTRATHASAVSSTTTRSRSSPSSTSARHG